MHKYILFGAFSFAIFAIVVGLQRIQNDNYSYPISTPSLKTPEATNRALSKQQMIAAENSQRTRFGFENKEPAKHRVAAPKANVIKRTEDPKITHARAGSKNTKRWTEYYRRAEKQGEAYGDGPPVFNGHTRRNYRGDGTLASAAQDKPRR